MPPLTNTRGSRTSGFPLKPAAVVGVSADVIKLQLAPRNFWSHAKDQEVVIIICNFVTGPYNCAAAVKKTSCHVQDGTADCSHLSLSEVPQNLPRNLTSLDMSHNRLKGVPPPSLTPYPGLLHLDVSYNSITKTLNIEHNEVFVLKKEDVSHCTELTRLIMASNRLKLQGEPFSALQLEPGCFKPISGLHTLIMDKSNMGTQIITKLCKELSGTAIDALSLRKMKLVTLTNTTFAGLQKTSLTFLDLSHNGMGTAITHINPGAFSVFRNLTTLLLDHNFISQILTGKEFEGLDQVQELHMANNYRKVNLSSTSFANVPNLRVLTLGKSLTVKALDLHPSPFKPLPNLTILDLSNNNIANIRKDLLEGLVNLRVLKLQHNNLARLWKNANLGGPVLFLKGAPNLRTLLMDSNGLDEIPAGGLSGLHDLRELSLGYNLLNNLKDSVFDDLNSLQALFLEKNMITTVRPEVFKTPMSNLSLLIMGKNPFDCTCESILWFATW
ncbi:Toll-like receptor 3, partial [Nibea albiflora]